jgi:flavin-dependent dehydrogenase
LDTDVFVVGGGPAGLAAAIAARQRGLTVTVADAAHPPIDKTCGEGIMPDGVAALHSLGVVTGSDLAFPFNGIRFVSSGLSVEARFPGRCGLGIRRTTLHRLLATRASEAGVVLSWGTPVRALSPQGVQVGGQDVRCRWVLGADGHSSRVRHWTGLGPLLGKRRRLGFRQHYRVTPWTDLVEIHWHRRCQAYVTPVRPDEVCVALIGSEPSLRMTHVSTWFPDLGKRLKGARATTSVIGGVSATSRLRSVTHGNFALIGDASGMVDAISGEGLSLAFRQALALGEALAKNDLSAYQAAHERIGRLPRFMVRLMLTMDGRAWLRYRALRALASHPPVFDRLLAIHVGALPPAAIGLNTLFGFAWGLLTAGASAGPTFP